MFFMPPLKVNWPDLGNQPSDAGPGYGCILGCMNLFAGTVISFLTIYFILKGSEDLRTWIGAVFGLGLLGLGLYRTYAYIRNLKKK